ncbi:MAG: hypothetical protein M1812_006912 [Candelaria pacifica]|nr:MAG: hypothetical protein M1812_006912 [Candelaria pacifica]
MPKRKRYAPETAQHDGVRPSRSVELQRQQVEAKIVHGIKLLNRALKTAKGFERQKLGKRRRGAEEKNDSVELVRLDAEIEALKILELPVIAETRLIKTLLRSKPISSSNLLPEHRVPDARAMSNTQNPPSMNVTARLYNSKPVKEIMKDVVATICSAMDVEDTTRPSKAPTKKSPSEVKRSEHSDSTIIQGPAKTIGDEKPLMSPKPASLPLGAFPSKESNTRMSESAEDNDEYSAFDSRVAVSSDEASEAGGGPPSDSDANGSTYDHSKDLSLSPSPSRSSSTPPPSKARPRENYQPVKGSTFIPSLMMGGYWSGSESGEEDIETVDVAPRKNRRGQQARRAIWEMKYGTKAKHLKGQGRDQGWDSRSGAVGDTRGRPGPKRLQASGANGDPIKPRPKAQKDDEGSLHPSWIAAKKAKEQKQTAPFQGKKVVFD